MSSAPTRNSKPDDAKLDRDLRTLARFVEIYCGDHHDAAARCDADIKLHGAQAITERGLKLCPDCVKLLTHAMVKRTHCPMDPKPQCRHCPNHCYHPTYRTRIRKVMKHSGRKLVMRGRIDYLAHLLF